MAKSFQMSFIPEGYKPGWRVFIDGHETEVKHVRIASKYGVLLYGMRPEGYDSWVFRESGGGGAVTLPYTFDGDGELWVGLIKENRPNMGEVPVLCVIGGIKDLNETHREAQVREAEEEAGINTIEAWEVPGKKTNSNRLFFVANAEEEGVVTYALKLPFHLLERADDSGFRLRDLALETTKKESDIRFLPWRQAVRTTPDALARAAIAQLLATIL